MIINIRVDHKIADIETMENTAKDLKKLFNQFRDEFNIQEYVEINTCNRKEYYIHTNLCSFDHPILNSENKKLLIHYGDSAILHLLKTTSGLESMIIGEDQILGQIKESKNKSYEEGHCGKVLDLLFTKTIHVGQVVRNKTKINRGSVSIGSASVDLAEEHLDNLKDKHVLVIGAGKMGTLVAKALSAKNLKAIIVANRTYYKAVRLAKELNGKAILLDNLKEELKNADLIISATGSPHTILSKERLIEVTNKEDLEKKETPLLIIDLANPRDIDENVNELNVKLFNLDDLRGIADKNRKQRESEVKEANEIIDQEFKLLKNSFKIMEVEGLLSDIRIKMDRIRQKEVEKAIYKLNHKNKTKQNNNENENEKIIENLSKSIVNKIFHDISKNIKKSAENGDKETIKVVKYLFETEK